MTDHRLAGALAAGLERLSLEVSPEQQRRMLDYLGLLERWNRSFNLTAVRDPLQMVSRHLLDSLSILPWVRGPRVLDAGTGAGLPGVPLAIARPEWRLTLLDSAGKKIRFLRQVRRELELENIEPVQARLEDFRPDDGFDCIVSRAFASLADFAAAARHLGARARLLAMKGRFPASELEALPDGFRVEATEELEVPGLQEQRHLVIMSVDS